MGIYFHPVIMDFFGMLLELKVEINSRIVTPFTGPRTVTSSGCSW